MKLKNWQELAPGILISEPGSSLKNSTSNYRQGQRPEFNSSTCINCFFCWVFCPENAIIIEHEKVAGINYDYCKGCGICVNECPVKREPSPLAMVAEGVDV